MIKKKKLEILKVDTMFKSAFKLEAGKSGFPTIAEYSRNLAREMATRDYDVADLFCNKNKNEDRKSKESFFRV